MPRTIARYEAGWHPKQNAGVVRIVFEDGGKMEWRGEDAAEFTAILQILRHEKAHITPGGWIATGVGDPGAPS